MDASAPMDANSAPTGACKTAKNVNRVEELPRFRTAPTAILFLFIKIHREDPVLDRVAGVEIDRAHNPSSPP